MRRLRVDEGEQRHLVDSVAGKAATFFKISRSVLSLPFSRRSRVSSARSAAVSSSNPVSTGTPCSARSTLAQLPKVVLLIQAAGDLGDGLGMGLHQLQSLLPGLSRVKTSTKASIDVQPRASSSNSYNHGSCRNA